MIKYTVKPIKKWPGERTAERKSAPFRSLWGQTQTLLARELRQLEATNIVMQADCDDSQIRISDGMLRADARLRSPGVILTFDSKFGTLSYPCDSYRYYQDNIRAIALALEALRKVDRYGVTKRAEQYTGWKALPAPDSNGMEIDAAVQFLSLHGEADEVLIRTDPEVFRNAYKRAARKLHPDAGGDPAEFSKLQKAKAAINKHFHGEVG